MTNTVTEEQIANLRNHAAFVAKLPDIHMGDYSTAFTIHECGTPLCAIGHAKNNPDLPNPNESEHLWSEYSLRLFGVSDAHGLGFKCFNDRLPNDPAIISKLMLEVADELESTQ